MDFTLSARAQMIQAGAALPGGWDMLAFVWLLTSSLFWIK
jgi:hypothetical protein